MGISSPLVDLQHQYDLLQKEYEYEKETYRQQSERTGLRKRVAQGLCWYPVTPGRSYYNSLNQLVIEIERTEDREIEHNFEYGRPVCFFTADISGKFKYLDFSATISYVQEDRMVVVLPTPSAILSFNGGKVIDLMTDKVLFEQALPPDIVPVLYNRSKEAGLAILSYNGKYILSEHPENKYVQYESFLTKMKIKATDDFLRDLHQPADKCLVVGEPEMLVPLEEKLRQELGKRINVYRSEAFYLELVPKGIDKAASLSRLLERTRIKQEEVIAIGDGFNDVSMIRFAGLGVAMANAQPPVKANADRITQYTNDEDGVARFIQELL